VADLGSAVRGFLAANAGVSALVGSRIKPDVMQQKWDVKNGPVLTYAIVSTTHDHPLNGLAGIARSRIEFTSFASSRLMANAVAEAVRQSGLPGYTGTMGGIEIESVMLESGSQSLDEGPTDGSQEHRYLTVFDYLIAYQESV
jgi:hypothetical protein